jgi:hypothetical protein
LTAEADGNLGEEDGKVGAVKRFGGEGVEGGEEFIDGVASLFMDQQQPRKDLGLLHLQVFAAALMRNQDRRLEV